jgi:hypothetical protein
MSDYEDAIETLDDAVPIVGEGLRRRPVWEPDR